MTGRHKNAISNLHQLILSGAVESLSLTQEIGAELMGVIDGISLGDESLLERVGVFVNRNSSGYRFNQLRRKVASYIGKRKALIDIGNHHLRARGAATVVTQTDYGLSGCKTDSDTSHTNTDWDEHISDAYARMQASIEAVEADVSRCQDLLLAEPA